MLTKNTLTLLTVALSFILLNSGNSFAQSTYCSGAKVIQTGGKYNAERVTLMSTRNDCGDTWRSGVIFHYYLDDTYGNAGAMLAGAMVAQINDWSVTVIPKLGGNDFRNGGTLIELMAVKPTTP